MGDSPIEKLRAQCLKRGVSGIKTFGRYFQCTHIQYIQCTCLYTCIWMQTSLWTTYMYIFLECSAFLTTTATNSWTGKSLRRECTTTECNCRLTMRTLSLHSSTEMGQAQSVLMSCCGRFEWGGFPSSFNAFLYLIVYSQYLYFSAANESSSKKDDRSGIRQNGQRREWRHWSERPQRGLQLSRASQVQVWWMDSGPGMKNYRNIRVTPLNTLIFFVFDFVIFFRFTLSF